MNAAGDWRSLMTKRWRAVASGPFFDLSEPPAEFVKILPREYLTAVAVFGGREGFLGKTYLRLYRLQELEALNLAYEVTTLLPELILFGSNGGGEAFAFSKGNAAVVQLPFLPLSDESIEIVASTFSEFVRCLAESGESAQMNVDLVGKEVHEIHPVCFGGSPTDPENKTFVPPDKHAELCRFWNKSYRNALNRQRGKVKE